MGFIYIYIENVLYTVYIISKNAIEKNFALKILHISFQSLE